MYQDLPTSKHFSQLLARHPEEESVGAETPLPVMDDDVFAAIFAVEDDCNGPRYYKRLSAERSWDTTYFLISPWRTSSISGVSYSSLESISSVMSSSAVGSSSVRLGVPVNQANRLFILEC
jgi:hypothetical protein